MIEQWQFQEQEEYQDIPSTFFNYMNIDINPFEEDGEMIKLNTNIWNNVMISHVTGYTIEMLKSPLHKLASFMQESLHMNAIRFFDIESIKFI